MSEKLAVSTPISERRAALARTAEQIDKLCLEASEIFSDPQGLAKEIMVAQSMVDIRKLLTEEVMTPIMALADTDIGFRTDRDPHQMNRKTGRPNDPYAVDVVRDCVIEAKLRGFHVCGNEFNIISGRCYGAKNGYYRKVKELTAGTFTFSIDPPIQVAGGTSVKVKCRGKWKVGGQGAEQTIGIDADDPCDFAIRVNEFMTPDAVVGKAERKLYKRVFERLAGRAVPDADIDDTESIPVDGRVTSREPVRMPDSAAGCNTPKPEEKLKAEAEKKPEPSQERKPEPEKKPSRQPVQTELPGDEQSLQSKLAEFMADNNVSFDAFIKWCASTDRLKDAESYPSWGDLPKEFCQNMVNDARGLTRCITLCKGQ